MRYVFVSDIHGEYVKMREALDLARFNAASDTLVVLGDPFDRGPQSREVLEFIMSCPHRLIITGNHDARLKNLLLGKSCFCEADKFNGVPATLTSFLNGRKMNPYLAIRVFDSSSECARTKKLLWKYFGESVYAAEWNDLIATHAWIPTNFEWVDKFNGVKRSLFRPDWRKADTLDWEDAIWSNTASMVVNQIFESKRLIVGHFHTNVLRAAMKGTKSAYSPDENYDTLITDHFIAIDGCSNADWGKVNVFIYESKSKPKLYKGRG